MRPVSCPVLQLLLEGDTPECPDLSHKAKTGDTERSGTVHINIMPGWTWGAIPPGRFISVVLLSLGLLGSPRIFSSCAQPRDQMAFI